MCRVVCFRLEFLSCCVWCLGDVDEGLRFKRLFSWVERAVCFVVENDFRYRIEFDHAPDARSLRFFVCFFYVVCVCLGCC